MAYSVQFTAAAAKSLNKLDLSIAVRIKPKILELSQNPRPSGSKKLAGTDDLHRIRVGDYRIVYRVDDRKQLVEITIVAHRRDVYRGL